ncbi:transcriptional regulator ATRX-like isoform X1 [Scylla paramamosain]|uniref:transcriptional regulator ATRX-like isoform X1 n=2 Tax=Scylla paramamosain TaxID=85552 RepID=UPI0030830DBA
MVLATDRSSSNDERATDCHHLFSSLRCITDMLSWYSGDKNMLEPFKMEEDPDGTSQQVAVIMTGKVYREAGLKYSKHPEVEGMLYDKLCQIGKHKLRDDVRKMALSIALSVSDKEFQPTVDWLDNFMRRFCLSKKMMGFHSSAMLKHKGPTQPEVKPAATLQNMTQDDVFSVLGIPTDCDPNLESGNLEEAATSGYSNVTEQNSETGNLVADCIENKSNSETPAKEVVDGISNAVTDAVNDVSAATANILDNNKGEACSEKDGKSEKMTDKETGTSLGENRSSVLNNKKESSDEIENIIILDDSKEENTQAESSCRKEGTESKIGKISIKKFEDLCEVGAKEEDEGTGGNKGNSKDRKGKEKSNLSDESEDNSEETDETDSEVKARTSESDEGSADASQHAAVKNGAEDIEYSKAETKYYNKNKDALQKKLQGSVMKCTSCYEQVNHHISTLVFTHPVLGLFICKRCRKFYGKGKFRKDKEGFDEYCRLCAEGGDLLCCEQDGCFNGFCKRCVKRIMGRAELKRAETTEGWACYVCDPTPLMEPRALHRLILSNLRNSEEEDANLSRKDLKSKTLKNKFESLKQMRQLRSQRDALLSGSKVAEPVMKTSKTNNNNTSEAEEKMPRESRKKSDKVTEKDEEVLKNCDKTDVTPKESEDNNPCPVLRKVMDEMLGMLSKCVENVKILDSKWKKSKYSSEGTKKARHHVAKQLEAMRHNFEILEEDLLEWSEKTMVNDNGNAVKEQNVIGLKRTKNLQGNKEDVEMIEKEINQKHTIVKEENNISDYCQSQAKMVSSEKDEGITEKNSEQKNTIDTSVQPDFDLGANTAKLADSVDHFEACSQDSSKTGLPSDDEHSLPDIKEMIKEIISDPDEPMDAEEKITMIKSLDMESEVPELLGDVRQKRKTVQKNYCKPTDVRNKEDMVDLPVVKKEFVETGSNSNTSLPHSEDKETTNPRIGKNRRLRSASAESRSDSDAGGSEKVQKSSQHKKMKLCIDSDENYEGNETLNRIGQSNKKNKEIVDGNCSEADKEASNKNGGDSEELIEGDIDKPHRQSGNGTTRAGNAGDDSKIENDIEIGKKTNLKSYQLKDGAEKDGDIIRQGKGTDITKVIGNDKRAEMESSCAESDNNKTNDEEKPAISSQESNDKEIIKENMSENQMNVNDKKKQENRDESNQEKDGRDADMLDKGPSNVNDSETGKAQRHESSSLEKVVSKKKKKSTDECNAASADKKKRKKSIETSVDEESTSKSKKKPTTRSKRQTKNKKRQPEDREDDILLGLLRESETSEEEDSDEIQRQSEDEAEEKKEKTKKKEKLNFDSESEAEKEKDMVSVDRKIIKKENRKGSDIEHGDEEMNSENGKSWEDVAVKKETDSTIKKEEDLESEKDKESLQCVSNGIDLDTEKDGSVKSPSKSKDKSTPKKRKGHSMTTENQKAKNAILNSDSENEFEDKPKPRSKKKHYRRHKNTRSRGQSHKKLNLKMTEEEMEELKEKQLGSKCQVLVEHLSSEIRKKLEDVEFIYTSDYPELNRPILPRQMFDSDGCDADEEDSDKEFSKLMKFKCDSIKPGPKSKSTKMKLRFMDDEGSEVNDNEGGISDDEEKNEDLDKKKKKATRQKKEGLLDIDIDEIGEEDNEDDEVDEGDKKKKVDGTISLNEKMKKHILMSSDEEAEEEEEEDPKDASAREKEEEEAEKKKHEKRKEAAKKKAKNEDSDEECSPKVYKKGYMNLNLSTDEEEENEKQKKGEADVDEEDEDPELESAYEDDSDFEESPRKRRAFQISSSDDSDSGKKKVKKKVTTEEESEEEEEKPKGKRKRIRKMSSSSDEEDDDDDEEVKDSPNKHKKIRKVIRDEDLMETTKNATQEEEDRRKRIAERQKHYNEIFMVDVEKDQEGFDKLVLDFDPKTKAELVSVHEKLVKSLKPHQFKGIKFMWDATVESIEQLKTKPGGGCILAHSMGLGKTLQVITFCHTLLTNKIVSKEVQRILVCCPVNTIFNWVAEFSVWLKGRMLPFDVIELASAKDLWGRAYRLDDWWREGGICVLGYSMFRNLSNSKNKRYKGKMKEIFQKTLLDPGPDIVVCDEGHMLKNEKTALSVAINKIRTKRRIILTGTPLQNNLKEYHCMIQFIKPNLLGTKKEFMNRFANPIEQGQCVEAMPRDVRRMKRRAHILHNLLEGCVQRMDYTVLKPYLPPKFEYVISVQLSEIQCKLYHYYLENLARGGPKRQGSGLFVDFGALSRVWTHPKVLELAMRRVEYDDDDEELDDFICDDSTTSESSDDERPSKKKKSKRKNEESEEEEVIEEEEKPEPVAGLTESGKVRIDWWKKILEDHVGEDFEEEEYLDKLEHGGKIILLLDILRECCSIGDKVLVFSQSLLTLDMIECFLQAIDCGDIEQPKAEDSLPLPYKNWKRDRDYLRLDGSTAADARKSLCRTFNDTSNERCRLFLISTKAGGLGINLVGANRVIIFDSSWNPSHDTQSIFRVYRFGQKKPCYIYRFVAQGTMEEKIYSRQVAKMSTALRVVDEHQIKRYFRMDELAQLYEFNPSDTDIRETPIVPKDRLLAELLQRQKNWIVKYHEHESLLENQTSEELSEEERKAAWEDYENEKKGFMGQNYRNSVMPVMGAPTILNHPGLPSLSLSSFSLEGVVNTIKAQNPSLNTMELCESVLLATKQIQKVHLNHYQRVQAMVYNLKNPMIAPEQRKLLPFGNHPEMLPMLEQQLRLLEENIQRGKPSNYSH